MSRLFILSVVCVFLTIFGESVNLILQLKGKKLTKWFGSYAFTIHMVITGGLWIITFILIVLLQTEDHPVFHEYIVVQYTGLVFIISGGGVALWAFSILGLRRALCLNFFQENVPVVSGGPYRYFSNPLDYGLWTALIGVALFTGSMYNLVIAAEFIVVMIPHVMLENSILPGEHNAFPKNI
ncbi:MAG: methyltransferase [Candidatus Methanofastidiosia archaeon]|jgi:protein-S-isoprenylcysteine O-methyltransferase Ste14